jgi:threonylcarbamoyladenosine tRNA methylthiotransferase MtaB
MPQVPKAVRKDRAARLRAAGEARAAAYLASQIGASHSVLMERPRLGRTEGFAEVAFPTDKPIGEIVSATITEAAPARLMAA